MTFSKSAASIVAYSFLVMALLSGCIKKIEETDAPLGVESAPDDVQKTVDAATAPISILNAKLQQMVTYEENYQVERAPIVKTRYYDHTLTDSIDNAGVLTFKIFENLWTYFPSGVVRDEAHRELDFQFKKSLTLSSRSLGAEYLISSDDKLAAQFHARLSHDYFGFIHASASSPTCASQVLTDPDGTQFDCIRYFNLFSIQKSIDVPPTMQKKDKCGGILGCKVTGANIGYDQVKFLNGKMVRRVRLEAQFANEIPDLNYTRNTDGSANYTPAATSFCTSGLETVETSKIFVTICGLLRDAQL